MISKKDMLEYLENQIIPRFNIKENYILQRTLRTTEYFNTLEEAELTDISNELEMNTDDVLVVLNKTAVGLFDNLKRMRNNESLPILKKEYQ